MTQQRHNDRPDLSTDTRVKWIEDAYRTRWLRRRIGIWFATHAAYPGAHGEGDTPERALDDLADCMRGWVEVGGQPLVAPRLTLSGGVA